jgi:hypothetical protein
LDENVVVKKHADENKCKSSNQKPCSKPNTTAFLIKALKCCSKSLLKVSVFKAIKIVVVEA